MTQPEQYRDFFQSKLDRHEYVTVRIKDEFFGRGGKSAFVVEVFDDGMALDFLCGWDGDKHTMPSIEHWKWDEIDLEHVEDQIRRG